MALVFMINVQQTFAKALESKLKRTKRMLKVKKNKVWIMNMKMPSKMLVTCGLIPREIRQRRKKKVKRR